jgi:hypothetical protein
MGYSSDLEGVDYTFRGWNNPHLIGYMESHDEERLMYRLNNFGDSEGEYNTRETTTALERVAAASAIFYSVPGPKMLWEFGEMGYDFSINRCTNGTISDNCRLSPKPIRWDYLEDYRRERLRHVTSSLIHLHTTHPTFSTENFVFSDQNFFVKMVHLNHPEMDAAVLANFRVIESNFNPKFQYAGTWYEYFTGDSLVVTDTQERLTFAPGEYRIYTSKRLTPPGGFISGDRELPVHEVTLYPSVFSTEQTIYATFGQPLNPESVRLYDMAGKLTRSCYYESEENVLSVLVPDELPAGMYVIGVQTSDAYYVGKVLKQ